MKYLLIFVCLSSFGQRVLDKHNLPELVKNETVTISVEVWIEDTDSEIKQRAEIHFLKKKIDKIHRILKNKDSINRNLDSLFVAIETLETERDSLNAVIEGSIKEVSKDCANRVVYLNSQLNSVRNQYFIIKKKHQKLKRKTAFILGVCIVEGVLLVLII